MGFPERLNELMERHGVTAYRISKETDISERLIGYWRKGDKQPTMENIIKLASYFEVTTDYLLGRVGDPNITYIPADPEKVKVHEQWLEQQRNENRQAMYEILKTMAPDSEQSFAPLTKALLQDIQDLNDDEAAKAIEYILFLKSQRKK